MDYNNDDKDLMRKKVLDEINNNNMEREGLNSNIQSFGQTAKKSTVSFNKSENNNNYSTDNYSSNNLNGNNNTEGSNGKIIGIVVIGILAMLVIYFLPQIKEKIDEYNIKRNDIKEQKKEKSNSNLNVKEEVKELKITDESIVNIKYPVLHIDNGSKATYLSKSKVTVKDISMNDLIYNSFITSPNLLEDYKGRYSTNYCGGNGNKKYIKGFYIEEGIRDLFGKKTSFKNQNFVIPTNNSNTSYAGSWVYDKNHDYYVYIGDCNAKASQYLYYDITVPYSVKGENSNEDVSISSKVGFGIINKTNKTYTIYSDAGYTNKVASGSLGSSKYESELKKVIESNKDKYSDYLYKFTKKNCPFREYCFVSVEKK